MNLKEAFHYQTYLNNLASEALYVLADSEATFYKTKLHLYSKADPEIEDLQEYAPEDRKNCDLIIEIYKKIIAEKQKLTCAINTAKQNLSSDIDAMVESNKLRQSLESTLARMLGQKPSTTVSQGTGYRINVEGNQVPFLYNVETTTHDNFDRASAKDTLKAMRRESETLSAEVDALMVSAIVNYQPLFECGDSFEDIVAEEEAVKIY